MSRRVDVVALVFGVLLSGIAVISLWRTFLGPINWDLVTTIAPITLVVVGVVGLTLSRNRD